MHDVDQALGELGNAMGVGWTTFDANGNLTLVLDEVVTVNIARIDSTSLEFWTTLSALRPDVDPGLLAHALTANHLGEGTGAARLALRPDGTCLVLCERVTIDGLDVRGLERRLTAFVKHAFFWNAAEARPTNTRDEQTMAEPEREFMLRV